MLVILALVGINRLHDARNYDLPPARGMQRTWILALGQRDFAMMFAAR